MAYETGTATSPTDLLQKFVTWLVSRGWTSNKSEADSLGWRSHVSKGGVYVNLRSNIGSGASVWGHSIGNTTGYNGIGITVGTGFNGSNAWHNQAGCPLGNGQTYSVGAWMQLPSGSIVAYHFFDDGSDNVVCVVERTAGIFTHLGWGPLITKAGSWTGGGFFFGPISEYYGYITSGEGSSAATALCPCSQSDANGYACAFVRADVDAFTSKWVGISKVQTGSVSGYTGKHGASSIEGGSTCHDEIPQCSALFMARQTSSINSQANLIPIRIFAARDAGGFSLIGTVPGIFAANATDNGFSKGEEILIGADTYKLFPNFAVKKVI